MPYGAVRFSKYPLMLHCFLGAVFSKSASSYDRLRRRLVSSKNRRLVSSKNRRLVPSKNLRLVSIMEEPRTRGGFACSSEIPLGKPRAFSTVIPRRDEHCSSALIEDNTENTVCSQRKRLAQISAPLCKGSCRANARLRDCPEQETIFYNPSDNRIASNPIASSLSKNRRFVL